MAKKKATRRKARRPVGSASPGGPITRAKLAAKRMSQRKDADPNLPPAPGRRSARQSSQPGRTKGANTVVTEDLVDFIVSEFSQGRRGWQVRQRVVQWIQRCYPDREPPSRRTVDKAMTLARRDISKMADYGDPEEILKSSVHHYRALAADPDVTDLVRLKARQALDELLGVGAKWTSTFMTPEAQAARALRFLQEARDRRQLDEDEST